MANFEQATRLKVRFDSSKGLLTVEDLWDLPLTSTGGRANLDDIARGLYRELKQTDDDVSFVKPAEVGVGAREQIQIKFDVVKHIIDVRVKERDDAQAAKKRDETKQRIMAILEQKQNDALAGKSEDELRELLKSM